MISSSWQTRNDEAFGLNRTQKTKEKKLCARNETLILFDLNVLSFDEIFIFVAVFTVVFGSIKALSLFVISHSLLVFFLFFLLCFFLRVFVEINDDLFVKDLITRIWKQFSAEKKAMHSITITAKTMNGHQRRGIRMKMLIIRQSVENLVSCVT